MGKPRCSRIARTPGAPFTYAKTRRLPPHLTQANTSKSNVLLSNSAQSTRGVLSFIRSFLAADWTGTITWHSEVPAWSVSVNATCSETGKGHIQLVGTYSGDV